MSTSDPIASPTLALLYIEQGHERKARRVVDELLERQPGHGSALALLARLRALAPGRVQCSADGEMLVVRWQGISPEPEGLHAVVVTVREAPPVVHVSSSRCDKAKGQWRTPRSPGAGAAVACIGRVITGRGFVAVAVSEMVELRFPA